MSGLVEVADSLWYGSIYGKSRSVGIQVKVWNFNMPFGRIHDKVTNQEFHILFYGTLRSTQLLIFLIFFFIKDDECCQKIILPFHFNVTLVHHAIIKTLVQSKETDQGACTIHRVYRLKALIYWIYIYSLEVKSTIISYVGIFQNQMLK